MGKAGKFITELYKNYQEARGPHGWDLPLLAGIVIFWWGLSYCSKWFM